MRPVVYDAGALIAAERSDRRMWAEHKVRLQLGCIPVVPSPVVAQVSRSPRQVQLRRFLRGCEVAPFDEASAHEVGRILGCARTTDVVDGAVLALALDRGADVVTTDRADIEHLAAATYERIHVIDV